MAFYPSGGFFTTLVGGTVPGAFTVAGLLTAQAGITETGTVAVTGAETVSGLTTATGGLNSGGNVDVTAIGSGLRTAEGTNAKQGTAVLVAGTVTVANTSVTANSRILLTTQAPGGTAGFLVVSARVAGTSFTILSSNAADTSTVAYEIFEPG